MYEIDVQEMSQEFLPCWHSALNHLNNQLPGGIEYWLRAHPYPPFLEHLSFRIGNQLFYIRVIDAEGLIKGPGIEKGLLLIAQRTKGYACLMPMIMENNDWLPVKSGWGLIDAITKVPIDPPSLVTDKDIEMTDWEQHGVGVQVVVDYLTKKKYKLISWQNNPEVDPSIWFVGDSQGPEWIVIRTVKFPAKQANRPENWQEISFQCSPMSGIGHFASIAIASADQKSISGEQHVIPLWRGKGMHIRFTGLE